MWPVVGKILVKGAVKLGAAVAIEAGAKHVLKKFTESSETKDKINTQCSCSGFFMLGDEFDQQDGLIVCNKCGKKTARYFKVIKNG